MRTVYPSREIAHLWANDPTGQREARGGSVRCSGGVLYSYAEPIGRILTVGKRAVVLYRNASWSKTTGQHQSGMRQASHHLTDFTVSNVGRYGKLFDTDHRENVESYKTRILSKSVQASLARTTRDYKLAVVNGLINEANEYARLFKLKTRFTPPSKSDLGKMLAAVKEGAKQDGELRKERNRLNAIREEERQRQFEIDSAADLVKWLDGSLNKSYTVGRIRHAYMRLVGGTVQTTKGASVPLDHVTRALPIVLRIIDSGKAWETNGKTIHIGDYKLDRITADGDVIAGCHTFQASEVRRFAAVLHGVTV